MTDARVDAAYLAALVEGSPKGAIDGGYLAVLEQGTPAAAVDAEYVAVLMSVVETTAGPSSGFWGTLQAREAGGAGAYSGAVMGLAPLAYYRFDWQSNGDTLLADSAGSSRHMTVSGTSAFSATTPKSIGGKAFVTTGGTPSGIVVLPPWWGALTAFSVMVWFKATGTGNQALLCSDNTIYSPGDARRKMAIYLSSGPLVFMRFTTAGGFPYVQTPASYNDGNWHCLVVTSAATPGTAAQKVYVDGAFVASQDSSGTWGGTGASANLTLASIESSSYNFNGSMDEVAIFGRELTAGEVSTLYTAAL